MFPPTTSFRRFFLAASIAAFSLPALADSSQNQEIADAAPALEAGMLLVKARDGLPNVEFYKILRAAGAQPCKRTRNTGLRTVKVEAGQEQEVAEALQGNPHIEFVEFNQAIAPEGQEMPSDPQFAKAWHLDKIEAASSWLTSAGAGITVAVVDTGVNANHPDLAGQVLAGHNVVDDSDDTSDIAGHGTMVAGIIAASTNNGVDVASIAYQAKILPVRITNDPNGSTTFADVAKGITWAADHGAQVINISYQAWSSSTIENAARYARSKGAVVVAAVGNDGSAYTSSNSPNFVVVGATDQNDAKASFSAYGSMLDFWAPGLELPTTNMNGTHSLFSGTSAATPVISGVFAQILAVNPRFSPDDAEYILQRSADALTADAQVSGFGYGRVNANQAVHEASWSMQPDTTAPTVAFATPNPGDMVQGLTTVDVTATDDLRVGKVELYADGQLVAMDGVAPFQFTWDGSKASSTHTVFTAKAYDAAGNVGSAEVQVQTQPGVRKSFDKKPPTIHLASPHAAAPGKPIRVSGDFRINATARDKQALDTVRLSLDGQPLAVVRNGTFAYVWNSRSVSNGRHVLRLSALDIAGNSKSIKFAVRVANR